MIKTDQHDEQMTNNWLRHDALAPVRHRDAVEPPHTRKIRFETFIGLFKIYLILKFYTKSEMVITRHRYGR